MKANPNVLLFGLIVSLAIGPVRSEAQDPKIVAKSRIGCLGEVLSQVPWAKWYPYRGRMEESGFNYVTDYNRMVEEGKILPDRPQESPIYIRAVAEGTMPPKKDMDQKLVARPQGDEIEKLKAWFNLKAPSFDQQAKREIISNSDILFYIAEDLEEKVDLFDRPFMRYFTITHLFNAGI